MKEESKLRMLHLFPIKFKKAKSDLNDLELAALGTLAFSSSEVNWILKAIIQSRSKAPVDHDLQNASAIRNIFLVRLLSSKLVEFVKTAEDVGKRFDRVGHIQSRGSITEVVQKCESAKQSPWYDFSKRIRTQISYHVLFSEIFGRLNSLSEDEEMAMYFHKTSGNSIYPIGEQVVFLPILKEAYEDIFEQKYDNSILGDWFDWCNKTSLFCVTAFEEYALELYRDERLGKMKRKITPYIQDGLWCEHKKSVPALPIFFLDS